MNREELKALGLTDEQIGSVMENYGKSVVNLQKSADEKDAELKKYQKGGELYFDPAELERLKTFEKETLTRETNAKKTEALTKLPGFKGYIHDVGEIKNGAELFKKAKADYADLFGGSGDKGVPQANPDAGGDAGTKTPQIVY